MGSGKGHRKELLEDPAVNRPSPQLTSIPTDQCLTVSSGNSPQAAADSVPWGNPAAQWLSDYLGLWHHGTGSNVSSPGKEATLGLGRGPGEPLHLLRATDPAPAPRELISERGCSCECGVCSSGAMQPGQQGRGQAQTRGRAVSPSAAGPGARLRRSP